MVENFQSRGMGISLFPVGGNGSLIVFLERVSSNNG